MTDTVVSQIRNSLQEMPSVKTQVLREREMALRARVTTIKPASLSLIPEPQLL